MQQFYQQMAAGQFKEAFAHMQVGARGYLPSGVLIEMPDEQIRQNVIAIYEKDRKEGA